MALMFGPASRDHAWRKAGLSALDSPSERRAAGSVDQGPQLQTRPTCWAHRSAWVRLVAPSLARTWPTCHFAVPSETVRRSEERRVGEECRSRGAPYHLK